MLMDLQTLDWDDEILGSIGVPRAMLPEIKASARGLRRRPRGALGRHPGRRRPGRPAGGALRADLLLGRRGEEHVRHRLLPAAEHRQRAGALEAAGCITRSATGSATSRPSTCSKARSRSPARSSSGCATTSGMITVRGGDRGAGEDGRGQRRRLLRAGVLRAVRPVLAERRPRRDRRADRATSTAATSPGPRWRRPPGRPARSSTR